MIRVTSISNTDSDENVVKISAFADTKDEVVSGAKFVGLDDDAVIDMGSSIITAAGDLAFMKSDGTWSWVSSGGGGGGSVLIPKTITQNGTYDPTDDNADGYSAVTVNVEGGGGSEIVELYTFVDNENTTSTTGLDATITTSEDYKIVALVAFTANAGSYVAPTLTASGGVNIIQDQIVNNFYYTRPYTILAHAEDVPSGTTFTVDAPSDSASATLYLFGVKVEGSGGGGSKNILSGTEAPSSSIGEDGDIFIHYSNGGIKASSGQYIDTGYSGNASSKYVIDFKLTEPQTSSWVCPFGGRPNPSSVNSSSILSLAISEGYYTNTSLQWGSDATIHTGWVGASDLVGKVVHVEMSAGLGKMSIDGTPQTDKTWTPTSITDTTHIGLFAALANNSYQSWSYTKGMILYGFKIYENDVLVHDFVPAKDANDVACLYDEVAEEYKYVNSGTLTWTDEDAIIATYLKVNGTWQALIGSDKDDVNTDGDGNIIQGTTAPTSAIGRDGDYYYKGHYKTDALGYTGRFNSGSTSQTKAGWEFTANENMNVIGLAGYVRGNTTGSLVLADSSGNILGQIDDVQFSADTQTVAYFDRPIALSSGNNYIVQIWGSNLSYAQLVSSSWFDNHITYVRGRYGELPGNQENNTLYSANIVIEGDGLFRVEEEYYKSNGSWNQLY